MTAHVGLIGLGTMGAMLALNIAEKGFRHCGLEPHGRVTHAFKAGAGDLAARIVPTETLADFVAAITPPRSIILMVPAGPVVDDQIAALKGLLGPDDLIIDAGNANFHDTNRRAAAASGYRFLGMGVSGGEEGARHGPSIMGGGDAADWDRVAPVLEAISAKYQGTPCATWMGPAGAGHFVKAVHNGIEYADMQMIAEIYGVMRDGLGMTAAAIGAVFDQLERRAAAKLSDRDFGGGDQGDRQGPADAGCDPGQGRPEGHGPLDGDRGAAPCGADPGDRGGGDGAQHLGPVGRARRRGRRCLARRPTALPKGAVTLAQLEQAMIAGKILCYAQGFGLIVAASQGVWLGPAPARDCAGLARGLHHPVVHAERHGDRATKSCTSDSHVGAGGT